MRDLNNSSIANDTVVLSMSKRPTAKVARFECNADILNVRSGPSTSELILCKLKKGDRVELLYKTNKNWARIKYNGIYGYVSFQYLSKVNLDYISYNSTSMCCNTSTLNISKGLSTSSNNRLDNNIKFMKCNIDILPIRMGPSNSERVVGQLKNNDKVEVVYHVSTGWTKIKHYNKYAYVYTSYLVAI